MGHHFVFACAVPVLLTGYEPAERTLCMVVHARKLKGRRERDTRAAWWRTFARLEMSGRPLN